jgi:hypothetical protein
MIFCQLTYLIIASCDTAGAQGHDLSGSVFLGGSDSAWCSLAKETNQAGIANAAAKPGKLIAPK